MSGTNSAGGASFPVQRQSQSDGGRADRTRPIHRHRMMRIGGALALVGVIAACVPEPGGPPPSTTSTSTTTSTTTTTTTVPGTARRGWDGTVTFSERIVVFETRNANGALITRPYESRRELSATLNGRPPLGPASPSSSENAFRQAFSYTGSGSKVGSDWDVPATPNCTASILGSRDPAVDGPGVDDPLVIIQELADGTPTRVGVSAVLPQCGTFSVFAGAYTRGVLVAPFTEIILNSPTEMRGSSVLVNPSSPINCPTATVQPCSITEYEFRWSLEREAPFNP